MTSEGHHPNGFQKKQDTCKTNHVTKQTQCHSNLTSKLDKSIELHDHTSHSCSSTSDGPILNSHPVDQFQEL